MTPNPTTVSVRLDQFNIDVDYLVHLAGEFYGRLLATVSDEDRELEFGFERIKHLTPFGQWAYVEGQLETDDLAATVRATTFAQILGTKFKRFDAPPAI